MSGQRERHTVRHLSEDVRLVHHQDDGIVGRDLRERSRQIVDATESAAGLRIGKLIAEAREPEARALRAKQECLVLHHRNFDRLQRCANFGLMEPPVMIAENGMHTERGAETCQFRGPDRTGHVLGHKTMGRDEIAEQKDDVGPQRVGGIDDIADPFDAHIGTAGMYIREHGNRQPPTGRPATWRELVARNEQSGRRLRAGIGGEPADRQGGNAGAAEKQRATCHTRFGRLSRGQVAGTNGLHATQLPQRGEGLVHTARESRFHGASAGRGLGKGTSLCGSCTCHWQIL